MIIIPSQFVVPFFIIMGVVILVCGIKLFIDKRNSTHESVRARVVTKTQVQIKGMAKGTTRNITTFEVLDTGTEIKLTLPPGYHEHLHEDDTGLLEYTAIKGKPAFFKSFTDDEHWKMR